MYYVYMLRCEDNSIYTGITTNIDRRMEEHFSKNQKCAKYTYTHTPKKLETYWSIETRKIASKLEYNIKKLDKNKKEKLIQNNEWVKILFKDKIEGIENIRLSRMDEEINIKDEIKQLADEEYKKFHSNLCPGTDNILGVRVPILRKYAKELSKKYATQYLLERIDDEFYEEIMLKGMIIGLDTQISMEDLNKYIQEFVPKINNWAICDTFCAGLKITNKYKKEMCNIINKYIDSKEEFAIRFSVVMILNYYIEKEYLQKNFKIFNKINSDKYYVKMAIAWAISVCLVKFYDETIKFLKKDSKLDEWTYNKSIQKALESYRISEEQKNELRKMKK